MHLVGRMELTPHVCLYCGKGHTIEDGETQDSTVYLDLERDVNWGDSVYFCMKCVAQIAATCGYVTEGQLQEIKDQVKERDKEIHALKAEVDSTKRRLKVVTTAKAVVKAERAKGAAA